MAQAIVAPFSIVRPTGSESPLIVEVPHAGLYVPAGPLAAHVLSTEAERRRDADLLVDDLFRDAPSIGASLVVTHWSRHVIDLNRSTTDIDAGSVQGASKPARLKHGLIWQATGRGRPLLREPISTSALQSLLETVYRPYHQAIAQELVAKRQRFGFAILLAAHSMPSGDGTSQPRADIVPGTCGRTTASPAVIEAVDQVATEYGLFVRHDDPYRGGYTTRTYGQPAFGVSAIQVEINRRLYLDEDALQPNAGYERVRAFANALLMRISR